MNMTELAVSKIMLRSYPKIIFLWPTLLSSFTLWIITMILHVMGGTIFEDSQSFLSWFWVILFSFNLFVMAFDFQSTKFFLLLAAIVVVILVVVILWQVGVFGGVSLGGIPEFNIALTANFYFTTTIVLFVILGIIWISRRVDYYKIERNEIYHKNGFLGKAERIPTSNLTFEKTIPDVFEYLLLRAGSLILHPHKGKTIHLNTVPRINKIEEKLDQLLSRITVEVDDTTEPEE